MPKASAIAIDGPSGVGKSVVGRLLAQRLGYVFVDTGAMYRAVTWLAIERGVDPTDEEALARVARESNIVITGPTKEDGRPYSVFVQGRDATWDLRSPKVEALVSVVSMASGVREAMVAQQREMARACGVVMVGRDIGTVVLPQAELKVYLTASQEERALRRFRELRDRGEDVDWEALGDEMARRDRIDSERACSPLRPARDARIIDTENRSIEEVVAEIERILKGK